MQRIRFDRKSVAVVILVLGLGGLGFIQYRMLDAYFTLSREKLDQQVAITLAETGEETYERSLLSNLISAIITEDTLSFPVGLDSLQRAGTQFYRMYLTDRFARANLPTSFEFAVRDQITNETYLASPDFSQGIQWIGNYKLPLSGVITRDCRCAPYLNVRFSSLETVLLQGIQPILLPALGCFLLLIFGFILLLRILAEKKYLDRVKNDFINNLTHELKTPVFSISLATRLMREKSDGSMDKYLRQIETDISHLKGNVEKVLELASIEDRDSMLKLQELSLSEFIQYWEKENAATVEDGKILVDNRIEGDVRIKADRDHLVNALNNLVENALKYGASETPVRIVVGREGDAVTMSVSDSGPGIDKSQQEAIFTKFYRIQNGKSASRGYGLGLSYARQVVSMMKGTISVQSTPGEGSIFKIKLPQSS